MNGYQRIINALFKHTPNTGLFTRDKQALFLLVTAMEMISEDTFTTDEETTKALIKTTFDLVKLLSVNGHSDFIHKDLQKRAEKTEPKLDH